MARTATRCAYLAEAQGTGSQEGEITATEGEHRRLSSTQRASWSLREGFAYRKVAEGVVIGNVAGCESHIRESGQSEACST